MFERISQTGHRTKAKANSRIAEESEQSERGRGY
jgi:hypothetical protein